MKARSEELRSVLKANGLYILGYFSIAEDEIAVPDLEIQPKMIALVGNAGSSIWPMFSEARVKNPTHSLDEWTKETIDGISRQFGIRAIYPFSGPPFYPFTQWAIRTSTLSQSPIGLTIHPSFGLWHAFRAALLFDERFDLPLEDKVSPCRDCETRPCLHTCPVDAFSNDGYQFDACLAYVGNGMNTCRSSGCAARKACPVGRDYHYQPDHASFHMEQLLKAHGKT